MRVFSLKEEILLFHTKTKCAESPMRQLSLGPSQVSARMRRGPGSPEYCWEDPPLLLPGPSTSGRQSFLSKCVSGSSCETLYSRPCGEAGTPRTSFAFQTVVSRCSVRPFLTPPSTAKFLVFSAVNVPSTFLFSPEPDSPQAMLLPEALSRASSFLSCAPWTPGKREGWCPPGSCLLPAHASFLSSSGQTSRSPPTTRPLFWLSLLFLSL